jgi:ribose 5-phosphate isomerase B
MRIVVGSDHAGLVLKNDLMSYMRERGLEPVDLGTHDNSSCDYPDFAEKVARSVAAGESPWGLLVCGTGVGMSMAANKIPGVRAAVISDTFSAAATRQHNNANVLCLGERVVGAGLARAILDAWLGASFEGGRHQRRVSKMNALHTKAD